MLRYPKTTTGLLSALFLSPGLAAAESPSPWADYSSSVFPRSETAGDLNTDGRIDRVVGYPDYDAGRGIVAVFMPGADKSHPKYHTASGTTRQAIDDYFSADHVRRVELHMYKLDAHITNVPNTRLGSAVAVADFNGDGIHDLAIGIPNAEVRAGTGPNFVPRGGAVAVIWGQELTKGAGTAMVITDAYPAIGGVVESEDRFGSALAAGDVNCDGIADLVIGVPRQDLGTLTDVGQVHVLYGGAAAFMSASSFDPSSAGLSGDAGAYDHFGAALAIGRWSAPQRRGAAECDSLAIGVPGKDVINAEQKLMQGAGAVHVLYARAPSPAVQPAGAGGELFITHNELPSGDAFIGDHLGATLGRVRSGARDSLWIGAPRDAHPDCSSVYGDPFADPLQGSVYTVPIGASGKLDPNTSDRACMQSRPDAGESEAGRWVEKDDSYGRWYQYVPAALDPATAEILVVAHGTNTIWPEWDQPYNVESLPFTPGFGNAGRYSKWEGWVAAAEAKNLILVVPQFEEWNFGNTGDAPLGGYRGLHGRDIRADHWVMSIVDRYARGGLGGESFYVIGQSAGAQFTNRLLMMNPDRLLGVAIQAPQWYTFPGDPTWGANSLKNWPAGLQEAHVNGEGEWQSVSYFPDFDLLAEYVYGVDIHLMIGELDNDTGRLDTMIDYRQAMVETYPGLSIGSCMVEGAGHGGEALHRHSLLQLFPDLAALEPEIFGDLSCMVF
jgi:hypothetical protein